MRDSSRSIPATRRKARIIVTLVAAGTAGVVALLGLAGNASAAEMTKWNEYATVTACDQAREFWQITGTANGRKVLSTHCVLEGQDWALYLNLE